MVLFFSFTSHKAKVRKLPKKEATNKAEDQYDEAKHYNLKTKSVFFFIIFSMIWFPTAVMMTKHKNHIFVDFFNNWI